MRLNIRVKYPWGFLIFINSDPNLLKKSNGSFPLIVFIGILSVYLITLNISWKFLNCLFKLAFLLGLLYILGIPFISFFILNITGK